MNRYQRKALRQHKRARDFAGLTTASLEDVPEKAEQLEVERLYRTAACEVVRFSQPRATMQTPGIPDLKVYCVRKRCSWWHEVKRPKGGKQSKDQELFQQMAEKCGETYILGGWEEAYAHLLSIGVLQAVIGAS